MEELYKQFEEQGNDEISDHLLELSSAARNIKWEKVTQDMNFTHSSRKGWRLLRYLGETSKPMKTKSSMDPDRIASFIVPNSTMIAPKKHHKRVIKSKLRKLIRSLHMDDVKYVTLLYKVSLEASNYSTAQIMKPVYAYGQKNTSIKTHVIDVRCL